MKTNAYSILASALTALVALVGCSNGDSMTRTVVQPAHWRLEIPQDWNITLAPPLWILEQDPLNVTDYLDRQTQFGAGTDGEAVMVALLHDADHAVDARRQLEMQIESSSSGIEFDAAGIVERNQGELRVLETRALIDEVPTGGFRSHLTALVQADDRPHEAWVITCVSEGDEPSEDCLAVIDSFEIDRLLG